MEIARFPCSSFPLRPLAMTLLFTIADAAAAQRCRYTVSPPSSRTCATTRLRSRALPRTDPQRAQRRPPQISAPPGPGLSRR
ncbi:hypothetical protein DF051_17155 [Burkholderia contaminans]|uniref:Uncharacterized protein n=1 Tax=Burkholderia contaminans TaxID=488447 RepID=A0A3N8R5P1_9BURK|nr:hypothetical protein DF051_17155 [Burkholderia contaminans]